MTTAVEGCFSGYECLSASKKAETCGFMLNNKNVTKCNCCLGHFEPFWQMQGESGEEWHTGSDPGPCSGLQHKAHPLSLVSYSNRLWIRF